MTKWEEKSHKGFILLRLLWSKYDLYMLAFNIDWVNSDILFILIIPVMLRQLYSLLLIINMKFMNLSGSAYTPKFCVSKDLLIL